MTLLQMFIIAVVQGISEFLPISSSGHLIAAREMLSINIVLMPKSLLA